MWGWRRLPVFLCHLLAPVVRHWSSTWPRWDYSKVWQLGEIDKFLQCEPLRWPSEGVADSPLLLGNFPRNLGVVALRLRRFACQLARGRWRPHVVIDPLQNGAGETMFCALHSPPISRSYEREESPANGSVAGRHVSVHGASSKNGSESSQPLSEGTCCGGILGLRGRRRFLRGGSGSVIPHGHSMGILLSVNARETLRFGLKR